MSYKRDYKKPAPIVRQPRVHRNWSQYQKDIFEDVANGTGNTQVDAYAGTGKTATIVESFYHVPRGKSVLMCAFNKSIQAELESRAPEGIEVKTLHAIGYAACRRAFSNNLKLDNTKLRGYIRAEIGDDSKSKEFSDSLEQCVSLCKSYLAESPKDVDDVMDRHDVDHGTESRENFIELTLKIMNNCKRDTARLDFDDMVWFPNVHNLRLTQYNRVKIDEVQDLTLAQINLALNSVLPNGRIMSVGDEFQSIYSFRGADSNAISNIVERLNSKRMPLSVTYRCAKSIVSLAKSFVPGLEAAPEAEEGSVEEITTSQIENLVKPGDFILSRVNAPLIRWCLALLKAGTPANIQGRDVGQSLMAWIKKSKSNSVSSFLQWLADFQAMENERLTIARKNTDTLNDKVECMRALCEGVPTMDGVKENINHLFKDGDDKNRVILSSTHKAKGLERDRVFILQNTYKPTKGQEEKNLYYVALTRAKKSLYLVSGI